MEALRQEALKAEALRGMKTGRRLLPSHRRLQLYVKTLSAAWSPWAAGDDLKLRNEPAGWEVSSHKDQRMRQVGRAFLVILRFVADASPSIPC